MTAQNYERERDAARQMALEAAEVVRQWHERGVQVEWKGKDDPVTSADHGANEVLVQRIREQFPDDALLSEESRDDLSRLSASRVWIVDPLDGTKDFIAGTGDFAVMVGLAVSGRPVVGVVCRPLDGTLWSASAGGGAYRESGSGPAKRLSVSSVADPADMALVVTRTHRFPLLERLVETLGITREKPLGSVGLKVGALATAEADLYVHLSMGIKEWDTCAPEIILTEAGGVMTDALGAPLQYNCADVMRRQGVVASNNQAHASIIQTIAPLAREAFPTENPVS